MYWESPGSNKHLQTSTSLEPQLVKVNEANSIAPRIVIILFILLKFNLASYSSGFSVSPRFLSGRWSPLLFLQAGKTVKNCKVSLWWLSGLSAMFFLTYPNPFN
jgi:hypothetical protein